VTSGYDLITFVTDYGLEGGFVGSLHAVVDQIVADRSSSQVRIIDLDHFVPPQDVLLGALRMERLLAYTRAGVHVGVVDPGVGTSRRPVAVNAGGRVFVGPDNGLLAFAVDAAGGAEQAVLLERYLLPHRAVTFDGRDVFAPAAAHLACGMQLRELGSEIDPASLQRLERPVVHPLAGGGVEVRVVQVDGFGNVQFGAGPTVLSGLGDRAEITTAGGTLTVAVGSTFGDVAAGEAVLLVDSDACAALSVNQGRASELLGGLRPGDAVRLTEAPRAAGAR
jgi:S-adenosylmethionine hydrolase